MTSGASGLVRKIPKILQCGTNPEQRLVRHGGNIQLLVCIVNGGSWLFSPSCSRARFLSAASASRMRSWKGCGVRSKKVAEAGALGVVGDADLHVRQAGEPLDRGGIGGAHVGGGDHPDRDAALTQLLEGRDEQAQTGPPAPPSAGPRVHR